MAMMAVLSVKNLKLYYGTLRGSVKAVDDVVFDLENGEALGLVGESGCGKSSTAIALIRLLPSNVVKFEGEILFEGKNLTTLSDEEIRSEIRWKKISMVFQGAMNTLNPVLKVGFQVAEPLIVHKKVEKEEALDKARELFKLVGLPPEYVERYPHELSGGMRQRVVIATALALNPKVVILDEPTSALDVSVQAQIMNLLKRLKKQLHLSMIYITHDIALASDLCDKIGVMYAGEIVELGPIEKVLLTPKHPYTQKLISCIPHLKGNKMPEFIPGAPPDLTNPPSGCKFHPRCQHVMEKCKVNRPHAINVDGRLVKCWLYE
jgi:peptide/nickel transport system ATP-binding protein